MGYMQVGALVYNTKEGRSEDGARGGEGKQANILFTFLQVFCMSANAGKQRNKVETR